MFKVTFTKTVQVKQGRKMVSKTFENTEIHKSEADYRLRAMALNLQIKSVEAV